MGTELRVVSDSRELFFKIYKITKIRPEFMYSLNQQIIRASISVGSNIVEGKRRGGKEFKRFIDISIGSCDEVKYQLTLYQDINDDLSQAIVLCDKIIGQLINLKKSISHNP